MNANVVSSKQLLERARILFGLKRYTDVDAEIRGLLAQEPGNARAHMWLALTLLARNERSTRSWPEHTHELEDALREADKAISLEPTRAFFHAVRADVLLALNRTTLALQSTQEALRLDPQYPFYHVLLSRVHYYRQKRNAMLAAANKALEYAPEDIDAINQRIAALLMLRRLEEAAQSLKWVLARDPVNAVAHGNLGWLCVHRSKPKQAVPHFREALRLDPNLESARLGLVRAMLNSHWLWRPLVFLYLCASLAVTSMFLGLAIGLLGTWGIMATEFGPVLFVGLLFLAFLVFWAFIVWASPMCLQILLRFSASSRQILSETEVMGTNWGVICLAVMLAFVVGAVIVNNGTLLLGAIWALSMLIPIGVLLKMPPDKHRSWLTIYAASLGGTGILSLGGAWTEAWWTVYPASVFLLGWAAYLLIAYVLLVLKWEAMWSAVKVFFRYKTQNRVRLDDT